MASAYVIVRTTKKGERRSTSSIPDERPGVSAVGPRRGLQDRREKRGSGRGSWTASWRH